MYGLAHKPYIPQRTESQQRYKRNVGFCVELYSFFVPPLFMYSVELKRSDIKPYTKEKLGVGGQESLRSAESPCRCVGFDVTPFQRYTIHK